MTLKEKKKKRTTLATLSSRGQEQSSPLQKKAKQSVFHTEREREREGVSEVGKLGEMERGSEREEEAERMRINTELARGSREQPGLSARPLGLFSRLGPLVRFREWNAKPHLAGTCSAALMISSQWHILPLNVLLSCCQGPGFWERLPFFENDTILGFKAMVGFCLQNT